jgi:hypothetical protein
VSLGLVTVSGSMVIDPRLGEGSSGDIRSNSKVVQPSLASSRLRATRSRRPSKPVIKVAAAFAVIISHKARARSNADVSRSAQVSSPLPPSLASFGTTLSHEGDRSCIELSRSLESRWRILRSLSFQGSTAPIITTNKPTAKRRTRATQRSRLTAACNRSARELTGTADSSFAHLNSSTPLILFAPDKK